MTRAQVFVGIDVSKAQLDMPSGRRDGSPHPMMTAGLRRSSNA